MNAKRLLLPSIGLLVAVTLQCSTYFNMFYNAEEAYREGYRIHQKTMLHYPDSIVVMPTDEAKTKYDRAIEKAAKVLETFPNDKKWHEHAYFLMGEAYFYEKEMPKAIRWFRVLQQEYPKSSMIPESYLFVGKAYLVNEDLDKAEETLKYVLATYPELDKDQQVSLLMVELETKREGESQAIKRLEKVSATVKSEDKKADLMIRVAEMFMDLRQYDSAIARLSGTPRLNSDPEQSYRIDRDLVTCYVDCDSSAHAVALLDEMLHRRKNASHEREITYDKGMILERMGKTDDAIAAFKDVVGPSDSTSVQSDTSQMVGKALYQLGLLYQKRKCNFREAQKCFRSINDRKGRDSSVSTVATARMNAMQKIANLRRQLGERETWKLLGLHDTAKSPVAVRDTAKQLTGRDSAGLAIKKGMHPDSTKKQAHADSTRKAAPTDTIKAATRADMMYEIGELFYYDLDEPDSAFRQFLHCAADSSADSLYRPKALAAAAYIAKNSLKDTVRADSLFSLVLARYPDDENSRRVMKELKDVPDSVVTTRKGRAAAAFRAAEKQYVEGSDIKGAVQAFFNVYKEYSDLEIAPKSLFVAAWLTDNELRKKKAAKNLYQKICDRYPNSIYCTKEAKPRIQTALDTMKAYGELADASVADAKSTSNGSSRAGVSGSGAADSVSGRSLHHTGAVNPKTGLPMPPSPDTAGPVPNPKQAALSAPAAVTATPTPVVPVASATPTAVTATPAPVVPVVPATPAAVTATPTPSSVQGK
jgi:TolA-binding protein